MTVDQVFRKIIAPDRILDHVFIYLNICEYRSDDGASVRCHAFSFCMNEPDIDLFREGALLTVVK